MARISGIDLPKGKRLDIALTYIYGVGSHISKLIIDETQIDPAKRVKDLSEDEVNKLITVVTSYKVEGDLRREIQQNIRRLTDIASYRGLRHRRGLPVRGQRTKTNGRTRRGRRQTVGAGKGAAKAPGKKG